VRNFYTEVQASRPTSLTAAVGLARLYEAKHQAQRRNPAQETKKTPHLPPMRGWKLLFYSCYMEPTT
jgi:hypothetical protein